MHLPQLINTGKVRVIYCFAMFGCTFILLLGLAAASPFPQKRFINLNTEDLKRLESVLLKRHEYQGDDTVITAFINGYTDKILANIDSIMPYQKFDPMEMPDISEKFHELLLSGEFTLSEGVLTNASTLYREGDCMVSYNHTDQYLEIDVPLAFKKLQFEYNYRIKFEHLGPTGRVTGGVTNLKMKVNIGIDFKSYLVSLDKYKITNSGHISLNFHGHLVDILIDLVTNSATAALKPVILSLVDIIVRDTLESVISIINNIIQNFLHSADAANFIVSYLSGSN